MIRLHSLVPAHRIATVLGVTKVMNKAELVDAISEKIDASKRETDTILTAILEEIMAAVVSGNKVTLGRVLKL